MTISPASRSTLWRPWLATLAWLAGLISALGLELAMGPIGLWRLGPEQIGAFAGFGICLALACAGLAWCVRALAPRLGGESGREDVP